MLSGEVVIPTLSGIRFLVDVINSGPIPIFSWDGRHITIGRVKIAFTSFGVPQRITLDDQSDIWISPETEILTVNGDAFSAREIPIGTSLLPLYLRDDKWKHWVYREPGEWHRGARTTQDRGHWRCVYRMVAEAKLGRRLEPTDAIRLNGSDKHDCSPENISIGKRTVSRRKRQRNFTEPLIEAQAIINRPNHRVTDSQIDASRAMYSILGCGSCNLAAGGIFVRVDKVE